MFLQDYLSVSLSYMNLHAEELIEGPEKVSQADLTARSNPIGHGEEGQSDRNREDNQKLHCHRLLPQTRQILIPNRQELLLAVWMCYKLI